MKNKYQEALDYIVCATNGGDGLAHQINILGELVDKATPKKPYMKAMDGFEADEASILVCPTCEKHIVNVWSSAKYEPNYCHFCGQKFLWSKEAENDGN